MHQHIIKPGETLWTISEDYRVPFERLPKQIKLQILTSFM